MFSHAFKATPLPPRHSTWPYTSSDFTRLDSSSDLSFYSAPRFVTHIDDTAIRNLQAYYSECLPERGRILDLCSSWVSHFPPHLASRASETARRVRSGTLQAGAVDQQEQHLNSDTNLEVVGIGMNTAELSSNPILSSFHTIDLNTNPVLPPHLGVFDSTTCVVSIDYLTRPLPLLSSLYSILAHGAKVHLILSNRCFPTKVIRRWLEVEEDERVKMVGDYLHFSGFGEVEVVHVVDGGMGTDPLWVVRGTKV